MSSFDVVSQQDSMSPEGNANILPHAKLIIPGAFLNRSVCYICCKIQCIFPVSLKSKLKNPSFINSTTSSPEVIVIHIQLF